MFLALVAAVALVSVSGAATAKVQRAAVIDVSTGASVVRYLRSIHVNPRGVVIQRGARNYAGPDCPGKGWSCTSTRHSVVQVASAGGRNSFTCSTARCAVVQVSVSAAAGRASLATNTAKCVKTGSMSSKQTCSITQSSSTNNNLAIVFESIQPGTLTKATSRATITQTATGAANGNTACVTQNVALKRSGKGTPFVATLNAHQSVDISQDATGSGANSAQFGAKPTGVCDLAHPLAQNQTLTSLAKSSGKVVQAENATVGGANVTLDIEQNQDEGFGVASGTNNATFVQTSALTAIANSPKGPISQIQSAPGGGVLGTVNQDSTGFSTANAKQTETQCEAAAASGLAKCQNGGGAPGLKGAGLAPSETQKQSGDVRKGIGTATQTGNANDTFTINQEMTQSNTTGDGQTAIVQGDCRTDGSCTVNQAVKVNGQQTTNTKSGSNVATTTSCIGSSCGTGSGLITNGSFEADQFAYYGTFDLGGSGPLTGWTTNANGSYPWGLPYPNGSDAGPTPFRNQWVIVGDSCGGGTWIQQTISTTIGTTYRLSFALASEDSGGGARLQVSFPSGSSTPGKTFTAPPKVVDDWDTWALYAMNFQANGGTVTIRLTGLAEDGGGCDPGIDNVSVTPA